VTEPTMLRPATGPLDRAWFVGCGNMGRALVEGWRSAGVDLSGAVAIRPSGEPVEGLRVATRYSDAGPLPRLAILAFKPRQLDEVAAELVEWVTAETIVVSILAGVEVAHIRDRFPAAGTIVRAIPNLPVAVRRGVVALYGEQLGEGARTELSELFAKLGFALWTNSEAGLAAVGSVAGAGPAYVARFVDALAKAGTKRGLSEDLALTIALETVFGTAWLAASEREPMEAIVRRVASPNGTTEAGLAVLDGELEALVGRAIEAAAARGAELARQARSPKLAEPPPLP